MRKRHVFNTIADAVLTLCCALAAVCAIPSAFGAPYVLPLLLIVEALFALVVCRFLHKSKKPLRVVILSAAAILIYTLFARKAIVLGAKLVWFYAADILAFDFSFIPIPQLPETALDPDAYVTAFLIFAETCISIPAALMLVKCRFKVPALLLPVPFIAPALIYIDSPPALYVIALLVAYWAGVLFGRGTVTEEVRFPGVAKAGFVVLLAGLALLIPLLVPQNRFDPIPYSQRRGILDAAGSVRDNMLSKKSGSGNEYDLASSGDRENGDDKAFSVCSSKAGVLILRTHSYGLYSNGEWLASAEYSGDWSSMQALSRTQNGKVQFLRIRDAYISERITPYAFLSKDEIIPGESFVKANGKSAYVWNYLSDVRVRPVNETEAEDAYMRFAIDHYTQPKGETRQQLLKLLEKLTSPEWVAQLKKQDNYTAAKLVADLVSENAEYSLSPGVTPEGEDFIEYFLTENRKGYCVHFASATTALLQALGYPARFTVGFRVDIAEAEVWQDVPDSASHAWTEVYIRGVGWVPVESTSGFADDMGFSIGGSSQGGANDPEPTAEPEDGEEPSASTADPGYVPQNMDDGRDRPRRTPRADGPSSRPQKTPGALKPADGGASDDTKKNSPLALLLLLVIPAAAAAWLIVGAVKRKRRQRAFTQADEKAAVLAILRHLASLERYGCELPPDADALAKEAAFSNHDMEEARARLLKLEERNKYDLCCDKPLKRFILRWVLFRI